MIAARSLCLGLLCLLISAGGAAAQSSALIPGDTTIYTRSGEILTKLLVVAVVLESAFATIFDWRVFQTYFSRRGLKTIVMIAASWLVVRGLDFDQVAELFKLYAPPPRSQTTTNAAGGSATSFLTALVLAGGSSGIYRLLQNLGFRSKPPAEEPRPTKDQAWVAVRVKRSRAVGQIFVRIGELRQTPDGLLPVAGSIGGALPKLSELLLRNPDRFPSNGGYAVKVGTAYEIVVEGKDADGNDLSGLGGAYAFAPGAIANFDVTL